ncbi:MAG: hypothetical protein ACPGLV_17325 [Bacteroidia bacterium]
MLIHLGMTGRFYFSKTNKNTKSWQVLKKLPAKE